MSSLARSRTLCASLLVSLTGVVGMAAETPDARLLTLEQVSGRGPREEQVSFSGRAPNWRWSEDRQHLLGPDGQQFEARSGKKIDRPEKKGKKESAEGREGRRPSRRDRTRGEGGNDPSGEKNPLAEAFGKIEGIDERTARRLASRPVDRNEDESVAAHLHQGRLWISRADGSLTELEIQGKSGAELPDLSPDGRWLACVVDHDLWVLQTDGGAARPLTEDGSDSILNGKLDWVYQEEIFGRGNYKGFWWSPDSRRIALLRLDESAVSTFTVVDHIEKDTFRVKPEITHYPKAGDPNPSVRFLTVDVDSGSRKEADLSGYAEVEPLVVRVAWTPSGDRVLFTLQDRIQTWAELNAFDPDSGALSTLIREENDSWVERPAAPRWLDDGSFLWFSDRTDHHHLYHYAADGRLLRPITRGDWSVRRILELDEEQQRLWFTSTKDGAVNENVYRIDLDGRNLVRLTDGVGQHSISFNSDRSLFLDRYSTLSTPPSVRLCDGAGKIIRELGRAEIKALESYDTAEWELHEIRARDGVRLDAAVLKPVPFRKNRPHPVWLSTYSGPDAPSVRNRWNGSAWNRFLSQQGFVVFQVNVRTASGKGHWAIEQCYKQLGVSELRDLEDAVDWLTRNSWADASRVGITGMSYGGFMAAFALTHSDRFALGIAASGVYDWGMYDSVYTERFMSTPQLNPEGYAATSVIAAAKDLKGHLLITHGVMDDNVHVQNAMQLVFALQKADKSFELMLYPQSRHGIGDPALRWHNRQLTWRTMREHLLVDPAGS